MLDSCKLNEQNPKSFRMVSNKEFCKMVAAHQSVLVRSGLKELLESDTPKFLSRGHSTDSVSTKLMNSEDCSSLSDRVSSGSPSVDTAVRYPATSAPSYYVPNIPVPPITHNISFLDEYKHLFTPGCMIGQVS